MQISWGPWERFWTSAFADMLPRQAGRPAPEGPIQPFAYPQAAVAVGAVGQVSQRSGFNVRLSACFQVYGTKMEAPVWVIETPSEITRARHATQ